MVDCTSAKDYTIREFRSFCESQLANIFTRPLKVPEIKTQVGKISSSNYIVKDIFQPFSVVYCFSQVEYFKDITPLLSKEFAKLIRNDLYDNQDKWVSFHELSNGSLVIKYGSGKTSSNLIVINHEEASLLKNEAMLDISTNEKADWYIKLQYLKNDNYNIIRVTIKSTSDSKPYSWNVYFDYNTYGRIVFGSVNEENPEVEVIEEYIDYRKTYSLPKVILRKGGEIDTTPPPETTKYTASGQLDITLSTNEDPVVQVSQSIDSRDGKFATFFTLSNATLVNNTDDNIAIVKCTLHYEDQDGQWKSLENVIVGEPYRSYYGQSFSWYDSSSFNLSSKEVYNLAFQGKLMVTGSPGSDNYSRSRIPPSLPKLMKFKLTIISSNNDEKSLIFEKVDAPLVVYTKSTQEKSWDVTISDFVYCDDTNTNERIYVATYMNGSNAIIRLSSGSYYTYNPNYIKSLEYKASQTEQTEEEDTDLAFSNGNNKGRIIFLYDKNSNYKLYGLRIILTTNTSSNETEIPFPQLNPDNYKVELKTPKEGLKIGSSVDVYFEIKDKVNSSDYIAIDDESTKFSYNNYINYTYNSDTLTAGTLTVSLEKLEVGKKYVAKYVNYNKGAVYACSKPFQVSQ